MNNYQEIKCKECVYHYTNDYENPVGDKWCSHKQCVKTEKYDVREQTQEKNVKYERS